MGHNQTEITGVPQTHGQEGDEASFRGLVGNLRELRQLTGKAQAEIASALKIKQPSVSQIERQVDMHLSTLRSYVEAVGGKLELIVRHPSLPALRIELGDAVSACLTRATAVRKRNSAPPAR